MINVKTVWTGLALLSLLSPKLPITQAQNDRLIAKIVQDSLQQRGNFYFVKGSVYNPNEKGLNNVVIKYYIWKKWMGKDGHGSRIKDTGGLVTAEIKYLPPKQTVDFVTNGEDNAPVMIHDVPDPLEAEISGQLDQ
jgi:hypothetical protein